MKTLPMANENSSQHRFAVMITRIVIIGDSETESALNATGFATMLNDRFNGDADISLRKFPGYTTDWIALLASSLARNMSGNEPDYVILFLGQDDCLRREGDTRPVVTPEQFGKNLVKIVNKITNEVDVKPDHVIIISPVPAHQKKLDSYSTFAGLSLDSLYLQRYTDKALNASKKVGARFINTTTLLKENLDANIDKSGHTMTVDGHVTLADKLGELIDICPSPYPAYNKVGANFAKELDNVAKTQSLKRPPNISAYTYVSTIDEYSAFFKKTYRGEV